MAYILYFKGGYDSGKKQVGICGRVYGRRHCCWLDTFVVLGARVTGFDVGPLDVELPILTPGVGSPSPTSITGASTVPLAEALQPETTLSNTPGSSNLQSNVTAASTSTVPPTSPILPCAFVTQSQVEELRTSEDVPTAIRNAEGFAGNQQNDYLAGSTIPAGVLIATDLLSANLEQFGVIPIKNQGGWGLFVTTRQLQAPNAGTYWCMQ